jgi:hypothetical protein
VAKKPDNLPPEGGALERRLSVAPMMDWTDDVQIVRCLNELAWSGRACLLYVPST